MARPSVLRISVSCAFMEKSYPKCHPSPIIPIPKSIPAHNILPLSRSPNTRTQNPEPRTLHLLSRNPIQFVIAHVRRSLGEEGRRNDAAIFPATCPPTCRAEVVEGGSLGAGASRIPDRQSTIDYPQSTILPYPHAYSRSFSVTPYELRNHSSRGQPRHRPEYSRRHRRPPSMLHEDGTPLG